MKAIGGAARIMEAVMYVSLKEVASLAGVSFQTASKVLNGNRKVASERTRARVLRAAEDLGYLRNAPASRLVTRSAYTIGIVVDDMCNWVLGQFITGAEQEARRRGQTTLISTGYLDDAAVAIRRLLEWRVDGILAVAPTMDEFSELDDMLREPVPVISVYPADSKAVTVAGWDYGLAGRLAAEHLLSLGHRQMATLIGPPRHRLTKVLLDGFRSTLTAAGVTLQPTAVVNGNSSPAGGFIATKKLFDSDSTITAIFAQSDDMAVGAMAALERMGCRIPDDCAVIGCNDLPQSSYVAPPLTTIQIPFIETGQRSFAYLVDCIAGKDPPKPAPSSVRLVVRRSTATEP